MHIHTHSHFLCALWSSFQALEWNDSTDTSSAINNLYLHAAALHFRLSALFDSPSIPSYSQDVTSLWFAATNFLEHALSLDFNHQAFETGSMSGRSSRSTNDIVAAPITFATNYLLQMIIAAGFTLLKLLNSYFASLIDLDYGKTLFTRTVHTIRAISVTHQDLPFRLAEVLAQLWRYGGGGAERAAGGTDSSLQVKVRCRMSMSLVYDSVWRWREEFQAKGRGNLESMSSLLLHCFTSPAFSLRLASPFPFSFLPKCHVSRANPSPAALRNPTNPDSTAESSASSDVEHALAPPTSSATADMSVPGVGAGVLTPGAGFDDPRFAEWGNDVFDPLSWLLDGYVAFPYDIGPGMEQHGVDASLGV